MDTIVDIQGPQDQPAFGTLPGELKVPPPAKYECVTPTFVEVTKPSPVPARQACRRKRWGLIVISLLGLVALGTSLWNDIETERAEEELQPLLVDPLDNLLHLFKGEGVEHADQNCMACFFGDAGRIRRSSGSRESFIVYKSDRTIQSFEVVTHIFNPQNNYAVGTAPAPFSFWMSEDQDADGTPDAWEPLSPEYRTEGSVMGWERGIFSSGLPSSSFLKIMFHDADGTWRPHMGNVMLMAPPMSMGEEAAPENVAPANDAGANVEMTQFQAPNQDVFAILDAAINEFLQGGVPRMEKANANAAPCAHDILQMAGDSAPRPAEQPAMEVQNMVLDVGDINDAAQDGFQAAVDNDNIGTDEDTYEEEEMKDQPLNDELYDAEAVPVEAPQPDAPQLDGPMEAPQAPQDVGSNVLTTQAEA